MRDHEIGQRAKLIRDGKRRPRDENESVTPTHGGVKLMALLLKAHEEIQEIAAAPNDVMEYADVLEVLIELARMNGISYHEIYEAMIEKRAAIGGLQDGLIFQRVGTYREPQLS